MEDFIEQHQPLLRELARKYPFIDGNKRTAYMAGARFLFVNGHSLRATRRTVIKFLLDMEAKRLSLDGIAVWLKGHTRRGGKSC